MLMQSIVNRREIRFMINWELKWELKWKLKVKFKWNLGDLGVMSLHFFYFFEQVGSEDKVIELLVVR